VSLGALTRLWCMAPRVRRRADTPLDDTERRLLGAWPARWATTVRDVSGAAPDEYAPRVRAWACAVTANLAAAFPRTDAVERLG
jgi:hypothetical protein